MPVNLSIKDVPEDIADRLRARAARNHRSLQGELMLLIEQAAAEAPAAAPHTAKLATGAATGASSDAATGASSDAATGGSGLHRGWKTIEDLMAERRAHPLPSTAGLPLAVDIVRADRDSR